MIITDTKKTIAIFLLFVIIGGALYGSTLKSPFLLDDHSQIVENPGIKSFRNIGKIFTKGFLPQSYVGKNDLWYRPLQALTYMIDYRIWRLDVTGYHISSIALHVVNAFLIFAFLYLITKEWLVPILTGLFFLIHPINTEAVNWISSRGDLLLVMFVMLVFICYAAFVNRKSISAYFGALIFFSLALLCKETAVIIPFMVIFYVLCFIEKSEIFSFKTLGLLGFIAILGIYFIVRANIPIQHISDINYTVSIPLRLLEFVRIIGSYLLIFICPLNLDISRAFPSFSGGFDPPLILGILALAGSLYILVRSRREQNRLNIFFLGWFFLAFFPTSRLLIPTTAIVAERYMYLPAIGIFFLLAVAVKKLLSVEKIRFSALMGLGAFLCFWSIATFSRNMEWKDPIKLLSTSIKRNPHDPHGFVHVSLAKQYSKAGDIENALLTYEEALRLIKNPDDTLLPLNNMGNIYCRLGKYDKAEECFKRIISLNPGFSRAHLGMGNIFFLKGWLGKAIEEYKKVLEKGDTYPGVYLNMGICYERMGDTRSAERFYQEGIKADPGFTPAYEKLAFLYVRQNKLEEAKRLYEKSIEITPRNPGPYIALGNIYKMEGDTENAKKCFEKALRIDPNAFTPRHRPSKRESQPTN